MSESRDRSSSAHILVVGAGGLGCPATWALAQAGVGRITLLDPDRVESSNLPRQVLYRPADVGRPKAPVAARRLGGEARGVFGFPVRLDDGNAPALLDRVDVIVDATDGARTKDWLNQLAVRRGVRLVHAAALRSEARLLSVPAGGRPCLACLFGRLDAETGSCADLGVWNGVVGSAGFLAAAAALEGLDGAPASEPGYRVLDFESGRSLALGAPSAATCPVCAGPGAVEPYPEDAACAAPGGDAPAAPLHPGEVLDLRAERCPLNLLRARRALEAAAPGTVVDFELGAEGAETVPDGVRALGHTILAQVPRPDGLFLRVRARADARDADRAPLDDGLLERFARQVVLPEVGESGQRRLLAGSVLLAGAGAAWRSASLYLAAAGVGRLGLLPCGPRRHDVLAHADGTRDWIEFVRERACGRVEYAPLGEGEAFDLIGWAGGGEPPAALCANPRPLVALREAGADGVLTAAWAQAAIGLLGEGAEAYARGAVLADAIERRLVNPQSRSRFLMAL